MPKTWKNLNLKNNPLRRVFYWQKYNCKKIDRAFSRLSEGCSERVTKAISLAGTRHKEVEGGAVCLPEVALFAAGHRKSNNVTAR
ncbi:transcriptional antitermination N peptide [Enterobacter oligotrophicus]